MGMSSTTTPKRVTIEPSLAWMLQPLAVETFLGQIWVRKGFADGFTIVVDGVERYSHTVDSPARASRSLVSRATRVPPR